MIQSPNPSISIIIVTKNASLLLGKCLRLIREQNYDQSLIEILLLDGGSTDDSKLIAATYNAKFISAGFPENQEARRYIGGQMANGEILCILDTDNFAIDKNLLASLVAPFQNPNVGGSFTKWYGLAKFINAVDSYYALVGGNDPVCYYLGKNDRAEIGSNKLPFGARQISSNKDFDVVAFEPNMLPVIGSNAFMIRKSLFDSLKLPSPEYCYHIDIHVDILKINPNTQYAIVKRSIVHASNSSLIKNTLKRISYKSIHADQLSQLRRYKVFDQSSIRDCILIALLVLQATFVLPLLYPAIRGFIRTNTLNWFIHPIATLLMVFAYSVSTIKFLFQNKSK